jgi:hypothetical protein
VTGNYQTHYRKKSVSFAIYMPGTMEHGKERFCEYASGKTHGKISILTKSTRNILGTTHNEEYTLKIKWRNKEKKNT